MIDIKQFDNGIQINPVEDGFVPGYGINYIEYCEEDPSLYTLRFQSINGFCKTFRSRAEKGNWELVPKKLTFNINDRKCSVPEPGQGYDLFLTKEITRKLKSETSIPNLILSNHYPAVYWCNKLGIDAIGVPQWTAWSQINVRDLFADLYLIIEKCKVESITIIMDRDLFDITWEEGKDLYLRPFEHYKVLERMKACLNNGITLYWAYPHPDLITGDGSLYGLLENYSQDPEALQLLIDDLSTKTGPRKLTVRENITRMGLNQIKEFWGIQGGGAEFFEKNSKSIGLEPFVYNGYIYQYNFDSDRAEFVRSKEAGLFLAVGSNYFKINTNLDFHGFKYQMLDRITKEGLRSKYNKMSKSHFEAFLKDIPYFDKFGNLPDNINYRDNWTIVDDVNPDNTTNYYNLYRRISHQPTKGDCPLSLNLIKHVFGTHEMLHKGQKITGMDLGLDYMKLLYEKPTEFLPILCLISKEQKTGKSTYPEWIKAIFQENVIKVPAADLSGRFTSYFISKLLIYVEEALISKKEDVERLKDLVTAIKHKFEEKGINAVEVDTFLKVILTSNNETTFAPIEDTDVRFWVRKLKRIQGGPIHDFKNKLYAEIPHFLYYLQERSFTTEWEDRGWFHNSLIYTEELGRIRQSSTSGNEDIIKDAILDYMTKYGLLTCKLTVSDIQEMIDDNQLTKSKITYYLKSVIGAYKNPLPEYYTLYSEGSSQTGNYNFEKRVSGRTFSFMARQFASPYQIFHEFFVNDDQSTNSGKDKYIDLMDLVRHEELEIKSGIDAHNLLCTLIDPKWLSKVQYREFLIEEIVEIWNNLPDKTFAALAEYIKNPADVR
ncbi:MAG: hypothetical protein K1X68_10790 [Saprospiraceae bacterium]|nr:hypothetical protein [Saprospiraceae bacterium]HMW40281.1 DUF5906 domain-containing protein [Saprospiraceae bacterium]HMX87270.1 DUF5906 domain-containing protein [Saprospiraceae bacterium]HMZ40753.1 DUF5906 domain-containing protein [Saprospiraceae bacterium]HNA64895.1 DUF5906 domain-containing protein [Saprospiraceae bacterium]